MSKITKVQEKIGLQSLRGPINIFPQFFFQENWDQQWVDILGLPLAAFSRDNKAILENSPLAYLGKQERQILFLFQLKDLLELLKYCRMERGGLKNAQDLEERARKSLSKAMALTETLDESSPFFKAMANSYLSFAQALIEKDRRSRQAMAVAHSSLIEARNYFKENEEQHIYFNYYEALLFIGRGRWNDAVAILHRTLKKERKTQRDTSDLVILLSRLYIHIGMPHVAKFVQTKYKAESSLSKNKKGKHHNSSLLAA